MSYTITSPANQNLSSSTSISIKAYAVYDGKNQNKGMRVFYIVGGVIVGVLVLLLVCAIIIIFKRSVSFSKYFILSIEIKRSFIH